MHIPKPYLNPKPQNPKPVKARLFHRSPKTLNPLKYAYFHYKSKLLYSTLEPGPGLGPDIMNLQAWTLLGGAWVVVGLAASGLGFRV